MIKNLLFIFLLIFATNSFSQNYGNEWIDYSQEYYKFKIAKDGVYRISRQTLVDAKFPIDEIALTSIQLFAKGKEQAIFVKQNTYGVFEYLEFYGEKNTGWLDTAFYENESEHTNPNYSLVNDTISYFLTWNLDTAGKRFGEINETNFNGYTPIPYCIYNSYVEYTIGKQDRYPYYSGESSSHYSSAEGWFDNYFSIGTSVEKSIPTKNVYQLGPNAIVDIALVSSSNASSNSIYNHHINISSLNYSFDTLYRGYTNIKKQFELQNSDLSDNTKITFASVDDLSATTDFNAVSYVNIKYPRTFNFEDKSIFNFNLLSNSSKSYIEVSNFIASNGAILYDITNNKRIKVVNESSTFKSLIPILNNESRFVLVASDSIPYINEVTPVNYDENNYAKFIDYIGTNSNTNYLIISNSKLMTKAINYKNYRASTGYNVCLSDIDQIYDQFAYGIPKHPLSIRNFVRKAVNSWSSLEYLFILGKSVSTEQHRKGNYSYGLNLVPTFGYPPNDNYLIEGINTTKFHLPISIGRLSANTIEEADLYLNKVIEFETNSPAKWMKNVIHFGGGNNTYEQEIFASYLANYQSIIEDTLFGGKVTTLLKNSSDPIQITQTDTVKKLINEGASLITFFGHGYTGGWDQNIDDPQAFENKSKYPLLLANSCYTGNIHLPAKSISEKWVVIKNLGSIGFLASIAEGNSYYLNRFSMEFYGNISYKSYGKSIGKCIRTTFENLFNDNPLNTSLMEACLQFNFHGDPALILNSPEKPDLTIQNSEVKFNPSKVTTNEDNFDININISNIGKAFIDSFLVNVSRKYPDASIENKTYVVYKCVGTELLTITLPVNKLKAGGVNEFTITLDEMQQIDELSESNNTLTVTLVISSDDVSPVYPYEYSIIPDSVVTLKACVGNPFLTNENYTFEIDTTDLFNSPSLKSQTLYSVGGVIEWTVPFKLADSTVYFWRVSKVPEVIGTNNWKESSFIYIKEQNGWSQAHFFEFKKDNFTLINYNRPARNFEFINTAKELICRNIGLASGADQWRRVYYYIDGVGDWSSCGAVPSILVAVIDSLTLTPWESNSANYGQINYPYCGTSNDQSFIFRNVDSLVNFIDKHVPSGYYVLMYSFIQGDFQTWTENQISFFESQGALNLRNVPNDYPYILFFQKDVPETAKESIGTNAHDDISLSVAFNQKHYYGEVTSEKFGPSTKWNTLKWSQTPSEPNSKDESTLSVLGVKQNGTEVELYKDLSQNDTLVYNLENVINAQTYPYVKLKFKTRDNADFDPTPAQLKKWQLLSELAPETALNINKGFYFYNDTLNEGDNLIFSIATENISKYDMDSLLIKYSLQDNNNNFTKIKEIRKRNHPAGDVLRDTLIFSTVGLSNLNSIWVEVNPLNVKTNTYDQVEQYHFNNIAQKYFYIKNDITNPLLDVTFDGVHIVNGEIVSAKPQIVVSLKDENKFLALNDTSIFAVYLKSLENNEEHKIYFENSSGTEIMQWIEAELPKNSCKIIYNPELKDGKYEFRIQAKDISNNNSGANDFKIAFEVINKASITNLFNYPNPFSTSTRFVFTLTGSEIPDELNINIFTISGKLVKTINLDDLGLIHIGNNITNYTWDGTDMFGDKLANGVYYYTFSTKLNGKALEKRETSSDALFKNNIGKLYIMR